MSMISTTVTAHDIEVANSDGKTIYYNYNSDGSSVSVTYRGTNSYSYSNEYSGEIVIPETITYSGKTYSVTSIGSGAFYYCSGLTSVTIPNSVTSIGNYAFEFCSGLTSVTIPNSVTSIGSHAFEYCSGLKSVTIPNSVTSIGSGAFCSCSGLKSVIIPNSVTSIGEDAFRACSGMAEIKVANGNSVYDSRNDCNAIIETSTNTLIVGCKYTIIPNSVTSIGSSAFSGWSGLTSVTIPNSVTTIGQSAFYGCSGLTSVTIPNSVTSIGTSAFSSCSGLTSVTIPNSVTSIGGSAFSGCSGLTSVTIPNSVTSIGNNAFYGCSGLTSVTIPNSVTSIGTSAFNGCSDLTSVTIPNSVTSIGEDAFWGCSGMTSVTIPNSVTSIGNNAFLGTAWYNNKPDGLVYAGNVAYKYKGTMPANRSITLKDGTVAITPSAFRDCSGLKSVTIPNSVTSIGNNAFYGCSGLTSVTIPNSVTSIGSGAFQYCSGLTSVTIPNSVTSIGEVAFAGTAWYDNQPDGLVYAGNVAYEYKGTMPANTSITLKEGTVGIASSAFYYCSGLTSVTIPNSVTSIGTSAFSSCSGLTSVTIPNSVTSIGNRAFHVCSGLTSVTIGNSVTSIGELAFSGCSSLTSVTIPNSVTSIGDYAFNGCRGLTSVKVMRKEPPSISFFYAPFPSSTIIYVPYGSKAKYEAAQYWKKFNIRMLSDSNGDDVVNETDYSGVASYIMDNAPEVFDAEASDVDVNGTVDVRDYVGIANIITTGSIYGGTSNNAKAAMSKGSAMPATDESDAENVIYVENVSGSKNSQVELSVRMRNASDIRGFQFDLYLPEGVTMANNAKASLSSDRLAAGDAHTLMADEMTDGAVRFLCSSMNDENFAGGDGEIATLTVNIADNVANGDYDVVVKNAIMTETDISRSYEADDIKSTLTVLDQTGVETVTADDERRDGSIYTVGGQLVGKKSTTSQLRKGIYIRNGRKFVVK